MPKQTVPEEPRLRMVVHIHKSVKVATEIAAAELQRPKWEVVEMALRDFLKIVEFQRRPKETK